MIGMTACGEQPRDQAQPTRASFAQVTVAKPPKAKPPPSRERTAVDHPLVRIRVPDDWELPDEYDWKSADETVARPVTVFGSGGSSVIDEVKFAAPPLTFRDWSAAERHVPFPGPGELPAF